jgi:hypothetical protein
VVAGNRSGQKRFRAAAYSLASTVEKETRGRTYAFPNADRLEKALDLFLEAVDRARDACGEAKAHNRRHFGEAGVEPMSPRRAEIEAAALVSFQAGREAALQEARAEVQRKRTEIDKRASDLTDVELGELCGLDFALAALARVGKEGSE